MKTGTVVSAAACGNLRPPLALSGSGRHTNARFKASTLLDFSRDEKVLETGRKRPT